MACSSRIIEQHLPLDQVEGSEVAAVVKIVLGGRSQLDQAGLRQGWETVPSGKQGPKSQRPNPDPENPPAIPFLTPCQHHQVQQSEGREEHSRDIVGEDEPPVGQRGSYPLCCPSGTVIWTSGLGMWDLIQSPQNKGVEHKGVELGQGVAADVDVDQVKRGHGVRDRRQPGRPTAAGHPAHPAVHRQPGCHETQRLHQFQRS